MKQTTSQVVWRMAASVTFFLFTLCILCGCGPREPKLSKAAQAFKKEIKGGWEKLAPALAEPVAQADKGAIQAALRDMYTKAEQTGQPLPFKVAVLDRNGIMLTSYPEEVGGPYKRFADYQIFKEALEKGKITQGKLYLPGGDKIYVLGFPLVSQGKIIGFLATSFASKELKEKWGIPETEFLAIDFNT